MKSSNADKAVVKREKIAESSGNISPDKLPPSGDVTSTSGKPNDLTPEEQMALYEKDLKENDWGHRPC